MTDFVIETLSLRIEGAAGHEHRVEPIARGAAILLAARLRQLEPDAVRASALFGRAIASGVQPLDFARLTDAQAAERIAAAWLGAIAPAAAARRDAADGGR